ncbi:hypothetical protein ACLK1Z_17750 [Escherichia coli]
MGGARAHAKKAKKHGNPSIYRGVTAHAPLGRFDVLSKFGWCSTWEH